MRDFALRSAFAFSLLCGGALFHQSEAQAAPDARLRERIPVEIRARLIALVDSARQSGIPDEPLIQRALEGSARGVAPSRIVTAVTNLYARLRTAREALGVDASTSELTAAASALFVGVTPTHLSQLKRIDPARDVALPLVVLADIIERGVPAAVATEVVFSLGEAHMADDAYRQFRETVLRDVAEGRSPASAAEERARSIVRRGRPM